MAGRLGDGWRSLPSLYKKRVYQGVSAYVAIMAALGGWVAYAHNDALASRRANVPHVESEIRAVYLTPQLTELSNPDFNLADIHSATEPGKIALIMTDLGLAKQTDERAINDMPAAVALAFSPYGKYSKDNAASARKDGHKVIALVPMEPANYPKEDPGTLALLGRNSTDQNQRNLTRIFGNVPQADAAMNFMGSRFLSAENNADLVIKTLQSRKMAFVDTPSGGKSMAKPVARARGAEVVSVDIYIDDNASENDIRAQLGELERISRQRGVAVGVIHPFPLTFALLDNWLPTLDSRNLALVDVRSAAQLQVTAEKKPTSSVAQPVSDGTMAPPPAPDAPAVVDDAQQPPAELQP